MLATIGAASLDALIDEAIPASIRRPAPVALPPGESEHAYLTRLRGVAGKNRLLRSFIGLGYYDTITPSVVRRCLFENPSWYTPYTPYQAEIAQGRLESLLNFQTVVSDLTGLTGGHGLAPRRRHGRRRGDDAAAPRVAQAVVDRGRLPGG